jgi:tetratricopeptide (TPR) repeat protein
MRVSAQGQGVSLWREYAPAALTVVALVLAGCASVQKPAGQAPGAAVSGKGDGSVQAQLARAQAALARKAAGDFDEAIQAAIAGCGNDPAQRLDVGRLLITAGSSESDSTRRAQLLTTAITQLAAARQLDPNDTAAAYAMGMALYQSKRPGEAQEHLRFCLQRNRDDRPAARLQARCLIAQEEVLAAVQLIQQMAGARPLEAADWEILGDGYFYQRDYTNAVSAYHKALETEPAHAWTWNNLGLALGEMGRKDEAQRCFARSRELRGMSPDSDTGAAKQNRPAPPPQRLPEPR